MLIIRFIMVHTGPQHTQCGRKPARLAPVLQMGLNAHKRPPMLAAQVLAAQALPTPYAPVGTPNATGAQAAQLLSTSMSEEHACLVAQNILNSLDYSPPAPASSPHAYAPAPVHCGVANLANTALVPPEVLAALVSQLLSQLRSWSRSLLIRSVDVFLTEVSVDAKPAYAESMSDTRELTHRDLEDIVVNLRKQSEDNDQRFMADEYIASISDESDYESDETDQLLAVDEHIVPMAEPH